MNDIKDALDRRAALFKPTTDPWERLLRRARRRQRNRRVGAGAVALAVLAGTSFGLWRALDSDRSAPIPAVQPSIVATFPLRAIDLAVGEGSLWVLGVLDPETGQDAVWRIDPATDRVVATIPLPGTTDKLGIAAGEGAVWVGEPPVNLIKIDPASNEVVKENKVSSVDLARGSGVAAGHGGVWASVNATGQGTTLQIDPATALPLGGPVTGDWAGCCFAPVGDGLLANFVHGTAFPVRPAALATVARLLGTVSGTGDVAGGEDGLWVTGTTDPNRGTGAVWRIDPETGQVLATISVSYAWSLDVGEGGVWVATDPYSQGSFSDPADAPPASIVRIDPMTNRVVGAPLRLTGLGGVTLVAGEGGVWAIHEGVLRIGLARCPTAGCPTPTPVVIPSPPSTATPSLPSFGLIALDMMTPTVGWAVTRDTDAALTRVVRTTDGGAAWTDVTPEQIHGDRSGLTTFFLNESHAWVAWPHSPGGGSTTVSVFATTDGGQTWLPGTPFVAKPSWGGELDFVDVRHGWAVATIVSALGNQAAQVWQSTDSGATWSTVSRSFTSFVPGLLPATPHALPCAGPVGFLDGHTGFVSSQCVSAAGLWVTHDGGRTWSKVPSKALRGAANLSGPRFTSSTDGFLVALAPQGQGASRLYLTHDGGQTWTLARLPVKLITAGPTFIDPQHGWFFAGQDLYESSDGGTTWTAFRPDRDLTGSALDFVDPLDGWAYARDVEQPFLLATSDGGHTWVELPLKLAG